MSVPSDETWLSGKLGPKSIPDVESLPAMAPMVPRLPVCVPEEPGEVNISPVIVPSLPCPVPAFDPVPVATNEVVPSVLIVPLPVSKLAAIVLISIYGTPALLPLLPAVDSTVNSEVKPPPRTVLDCAEISLTVLLPSRTDELLSTFEAIP